jgi:hypothetical protein
MQNTAECFGPPSHPASAATHPPRRAQRQRLKQRRGSAPLQYGHGLPAGHNAPIVGSSRCPQADAQDCQWSKKDPRGPVIESVRYVTLVASQCRFNWRERDLVWLPVAEKWCCTRQQGGPVITIQYGTIHVQTALSRSPWGAPATSDHKATAKD